MISPELLRSIALFQELDPDTENTVRRFITIKEFAKREIIFHSDSPETALFMLFQGRLQIISISDEGKEIGIKFINPGDTFGEVALIDGGGRSATVAATERSIVGLMPRDKALWLFNNNPKVAEKVQKKLCSIIRQEVSYRSSLGGAKAFHRIYSVIFHNFLSPTANGTAIENLPTQQAIATMANVSRETVSRALHALIRQGVLEKNGKKLVIKNLRVLNQIARNDLPKLG